MKPQGIVAFIVFVSLHSVAADEEEPSAANLNISPECAAALITTGGALGAAAGAALTASLPMISCATSGFCAAGVAKGSWAATWQSSLAGGAVTKGSLFAALQSLAMGGTITSSGAVAGGLMGSVLGASATRDLCVAVDEAVADADSVAADLLSGNLKAVQFSIQAKDLIVAKAGPHVTAAWDAAKSGARSAWAHVEAAAEDYTSAERVAERAARAAEREKKYQVSEAERTARAVERASGQKAERQEL